MQNITFWWANQTPQNISMSRIEFIGWIVIIVGIIINTILHIVKTKRIQQNQQILIDEIESLRKELKEKKDQHPLPDLVPGSFFCNTQRSSAAGRRSRKCVTLMTTRQTGTQSFLGTGGTSGRTNSSGNRSSAEPCGRGAKTGSAQALESF